MSVLLIMASMVWQEVLASRYRCCPVRVPHSRGGVVPPGLLTVRVSSVHSPMVPVALEAGLSTNVSKSILILQMSVLEGQMVYWQEVAVVVESWTR